MKNHFRSPLYLSLLGLGIGGAAAPAMAADQELLDILLANGAINEQQYEQLLRKEELAAEDVENIQVDIDRGALVVEEADGDFGIEIGGRLHLDYVQHTDDDPFAEPPISGTNIRRSRIELNGTLYEDWEWAAEYDFANNRSSLKDVKIGYAPDGSNFSVFVGNQKQPYSLALEMSSNEILFTERSVDNALISNFVDRAVGVRVEDSGESWFYAAGLFGDEIGESEAGDEGWGVSGRYVYAPVLQDDLVVHLGLRGAYREAGDNVGGTRIRDETTDWSDFSIVDTGALEDFDSVTLLGPEFAVAAGPFSLWGEYNDAGLERTLDDDLSFDSWYLAGSWSLTGESRAASYRIDAGEFKGLVPASEFAPARGSWGAFELAAKYSTIDLSDADILGGTEDTITGALNWYLHRNMRMMFDWTHILDTDESNEPRIHVPGMDIFTVRAQYAF